MAEPISEEDGVLQEWDSETNLLMQIPLKVPRGIFSRNLKLTSIDVVSDYIALGTNCGLIYWYCRSTNELQRLHFEDSKNAVTYVKIASTVDYMVAGGTTSGNVTVFQIPKILPETVPQHVKPKKSQIERFTIDGIHKAPVTAIEWSKNGMKLFSGDKNGLVVLTEIDFFMHLSKSLELLDEQYEIVQLSYNQQILVISTTYRSIICDGLNKWKVHQLGTKERKILGSYGAAIYNFGNDLVIYASRPGHRLWLANTSGIVQKTLIFKPIVSSSYPKIKLLNPISKIKYCDSNFGKLRQFGDKLIVYNSEIMYVLNPKSISIVSVLDSARGIVDLAVNNDEIFILEEDRSILRIAYEPDKYCKYTNVSERKRRSFVLDEFASKLKDTAMESLKKLTSELAVTPERTSPNSPPVLADEALNLPPVVNFPRGSIYADISEDVEVHFSVDADEFQTCGSIVENKVNEASSHFQRTTFDNAFNDGKECNEIISRPLRRRNPRKKKVFSLIHGQESESDNGSIASDGRLACGSAMELSLSEESKLTVSQSQSSFSFLQDLSALGLGTNNSNTDNSELLKNEASKGSGDKSQLSVDTCESASERLRFTPDNFMEEQEKTFFRLANQDLSLLDSYDSEKTDNMSVSLNMTPSSSASSKISDNAQSSSVLSENISMLSDGKTENSASTNNHCQNDVLPLPRRLCFYLPQGDIDGNEYNREDISLKLRNTLISDEDAHNSDASPCCSSDLVLSQGVFKSGTTESDKMHGRRPFIHQVIQSDSSQKDMVHETQAVIFDSAEDMENLDKSESIENTGNNLLTDNTIGNELNEEESPEQRKRNECGVSCFESISNCPRSESPGTTQYCCAPQPSSSGDYVFLSETDAELCDDWLEYLAPSPVVCVTVSNSYVACVDSNGHVFFSSLFGLSLSWNKLPYKASWIEVSKNGNIVWLLNKKTLTSLVNPSKKGPFADDNVQQHQHLNVKHFALDNLNPEGFIIESDGKISRQRNLLGVAAGKLELIPCQWTLRSLTCRNGTVLAITSDGSVVCKPSSEERFRSIKTPGAITNFVELGPDNLAWIVDNRNNIYFSDDFLNDDSHWWETLITEYVFQNGTSTFKNIQGRFKASNFGEHVNLKITMIRSNERSVWVFNKFSTSLRVNKTAVTGYSWTRTLPSTNMPVMMKWQLICASGVSHSVGHFWLLSHSGDLFRSSPNSKQLQCVSAPFGEISCISSSAELLWVLTNEGGIFARICINDKNLIGSYWNEVHLAEVEDSRLIWITISRNIALGCDTRGRIYATSQPPHYITKNVHNFKWVKVEGKPKDGGKFEKVFANPNSCTIWAIDNKQNIYVRQGISDFHGGIGWLYVSGLKAVMITVSEKSVWALNCNGFIYRRCGITDSNFVGDYWIRIPGSVNFITTTFNDELWGVARNGDIVKLCHKTKIFSKKSECPQMRQY